MIDLYDEAHTAEESQLVQTGVARYQQQLRTTRSRIMSLRNYVQLLTVAGNSKSISKQDSQPVTPLYNLGIRT